MICGWCHQDAIIDHEDIGGIRFAHVSIHIQHDGIGNSGKVGLDFWKNIVDLFIPRKTRRNSFKRQFLPMRTLMFPLSSGAASNLHGMVRTKLLWCILESTQDGEFRLWLAVINLIPLVLS